jgi:midasin (ATPase involved in ribosome maturation)
LQSSVFRLFKTFLQSSENLSAFEDFFAIFRESFGFWRLFCNLRESFGFWRLLQSSENLSAFEDFYSILRILRRFKTFVKMKLNSAKLTLLNKIVKLRLASEIKLNWVGCYPDLIYIINISIFFVGVRYNLDFGLPGNWTYERVTIPLIFYH